MSNMSQSNLHRVTFSTYSHLVGRLAGDHRPVGVFDDPPYNFNQLKQKTVLGILLDALFPISTFPAVDDAGLMFLSLFGELLLFRVPVNRLPGAYGDVPQV